MAYDFSQKLIKVRVEPVFRKASPKQQQFGVAVNVALNIITESGIVLASLENGCIRYSRKNNSYFFSEPSRKAEVNGETRYFSYYRMFPGEDDRDKHYAFSAFVIEKAREAGYDLSDAPKATPEVAPKPAPEEKVEDEFGGII